MHLKWADVFANVVETSFPGPLKDFPRPNFRARSLQISLSFQPFQRFWEVYLARLTFFLTPFSCRTLPADVTGTCLQVRPFQLMCLYEIGWCHFLVGDYSGAVERFVPFLAESRSPSYRAFCANQLGCALDLLGRRKEAVAAMTSVSDLSGMTAIPGSYVLAAAVCGPL